MTDPVTVKFKLKLSQLIDVVSRYLWIDADLHICIYANILVLMLLMNLCHLIDVVSGYVGIDDIFDLIY